jgi:hypothetical protein
MNNIPPPWKGYPSFPLNQEEPATKMPPLPGRAWKTILSYAQDTIYAHWIIPIAPEKEILFFPTLIN